LIRALYRADTEQVGRVLYLNVDGLTNLAIAEGPVCRFTRVVGSGLEGMAIELAERRSIALAEARALIAGVDLSAPTPAEAPPSEAAEESAPAAEDAPVDPEEHEESERSMSYEELATVETPAATQDESNADLLGVIESGIREISGEVRNSLDFHRSQEGGGEVSHVVMSGSAEDIPGFAEALEASLGVEVRRAEVGVVDGRVAEAVSPHRLAVATGLAAVEAPQ
jgi:type IV pilus assembly protein PilM